MSRVLPPLIEFEVAWLDEPEDTREAAVGNLTPCRILSVEIIRRRDLTAACIWAANQFKHRDEPRGFFVRRRRYQADKRKEE